MPAATISAADQRAALGNLSTLALKDLDSSFAPLHDQNFDVMRAALGTQILPALGDRYGGAAATLAATWYDDRRESELVRGAFQALPAVLPDIGRYESLAGWAMSPLFRGLALRAALPLVVAGLGVGITSVVMNAHRDTVLRSSDADPQAEGWKRESGDAEPCDFCRMLIARGAVYTKKTSRFVAHDHCHCVAAPSWRGKAGRKHGEVPQVARRVSDKRISDATRKANNRRATEWIQEHYH